MKTHKNVKCIKIYSKGLLKNNFVFVEISDTNLIYQLRSKSLIHLRDFDLKYVWFSFRYCFITVQWQSILKLQWSNGWVFVYRLSGSGFESSCIQVTIECGFTLKRVRDMIRTYSLFTFECLCLEPTKTGFGLSWLKYILSASSANQSHKLDKSFSSWFSN